MVKFITLTGEITGSARLNMQRSRPELYLRLRTRRSGRLRAFVTDGSKVREVALSGNSGTFENMEVRGLILTDESGNVISSGSGGMCAKELESFKIGIRMLINAKDDTEKHRTSHTAYTSNQKDNPLAHQVQSSANTNQPPNANPEKSFKQNMEGQSSIKPVANASATQHDTRQSKQNTDGQSPTMNAAKPSSARHDIMQSNQNASYRVNSEKSQRQTTGTRGNKNQNTSNTSSVKRRLTHEALENPKSPATAEILNKAGYLFRGETIHNDEQGSLHKLDSTCKNNMYDLAFSDIDIKTSECNNCKKETMPPMREAVENPFPNFFDNSYWWRNEGDTKHIHGIANVRGIKYNVTAIRSNSKYPPNGIGRSVRRMYSSDGKRFWVGLTKV